MGEKGKKEEKRMSRVERFILYTGRPDTGDMGGGGREAREEAALGNLGCLQYPFWERRPWARGAGGVASRPIRAGLPCFPDNRLF